MCVCRVCPWWWDDGLSPCPAINGYMYGNQPGLSMCQRDRVSWHLMGMGTDTDMHGAYFQGNTLLLRGAHRDSLALFPHVSTTAFMQPDHAGERHSPPRHQPQGATEVGQTRVLLPESERGGARAVPVPTGVSTREKQWLMPSRQRWASLAPGERAPPASLNFA